MEDPIYQICWTGFGPWDSTSPHSQWLAFDNMPVNHEMAIDIKNESTDYGNATYRYD